MNRILLALSTAAMLLIGGEPCFGQTTKSFSGSFERGEANYTYYEKNGEHVKHGSFSYSRKETNSDGSANIRISGRLEHGKREGAWTYNIEYKDYWNGATYLTGTIRMSTRYTDGLPDGDWSYTENTKNRNKTFNGHTYVWGPYDVAPVTSVDAHFSRGTLTGNFDMKNVTFASPYHTMKGSLDESGFFIGKWSFISEMSVETSTFYENVLVASFARGKSGETLADEHLSEQDMELVKGFKTGTRSTSDLAEAGLVIDTVQSVSSTLFGFKTTLYHSMFLHREIGGDMSYYSKNGEYVDERKGGRIIMVTKYDPVSLEDVPEFAMVRDFEDDYSLMMYDQLVKRLEFVRWSYQRRLTAPDLQRLDTLQAFYLARKEKLNTILTEKEAQRKQVDKLLAHGRLDSVRKAIRIQQDVLGKFGQWLTDKDRADIDAQTKRAQAQLEQLERQEYESLFNETSGYMATIRRSVGTNFRAYLIADSMRRVLMNAQVPALYADKQHDLYDSYQSKLKALVESDLSKMESELAGLHQDDLENSGVVRAFRDSVKALVGKYQELATGIETMMRNALRVQLVYMRLPTVQVVTFQKRRLYQVWADAEDLCREQVLNATQALQMGKVVDEMNSLAAAMLTLKDADTKELEKQVKKTEDLGERIKLVTER